MTPPSRELNLAHATASMLGGGHPACQTLTVLAPKTVAASKTTFSQTMLPSDANPFGNVHGGEIMKLIDACAGVAPRSGAAAARAMPPTTPPSTPHWTIRVVTARVDELSFVAPVYVGDLVTAHASVNDVGGKSMEIGVRVEAENTFTGTVVHVSSAYLVFVAIDEQGKPVPVPPLIAESDDEHRRMAAAKERRARRLRQTPTP